MIGFEAYALYENEIRRSNMSAAGNVALVKENPFIGQIIVGIPAELLSCMKWRGKQCCSEGTVAGLSDTLNLETVE